MKELNLFLCCLLLCWNALFLASKLNINIQTNIPGRLLRRNEKHIFATFYPLLLLRRWFRLHFSLSPAPSLTLFRSFSRAFMLFCVILNSAPSTGQTRINFNSNCMFCCAVRKRLAQPHDVFLFLNSDSINMNR